MTVYFQDESVTLHLGDALEVARNMPDGSVDCIVTSPPYYGLRDYGDDGQYGLEPSADEYADKLAQLFSELYRVLKTSGTAWIVIADSYGGGGIARMSGKWPTTHNPGDRTNGKRRSYEKEKCLLGAPDLLASKLVDEGWVIRNRIIWVKGRPIPSSASDRFNSQYEYVFLLAKRDGRRPNYWFDRAQAPPGDVWHFDVSRFPGGHFATFPPELAERCILTGCKPGGTVLDPFSGSGTAGMAAVSHGRKYIGIDLNPEYHNLALRTRLSEVKLNFGGAA